MTHSTGFERSLLWLCADVEVLAPRDALVNFTPRGCRMYRRRLIRNVSESSAARASSMPCVPQPPCSGLSSSRADPFANAPGPNK